MVVSDGRSRRISTAVAVVAGVGVLAAACTHPRPPRSTTTTRRGTTTTSMGTTSTTAPPAGTVPATGEMVRSALPREAAGADGTGPAVGAIASFGTAMYRGVVAGHPGENTVFSPLSLETVLAMVRNGATGEARRQMDDVLAATGPAAGSALDRSLNALDTVLASRAGPVSVGQTTGEVGLRSANDLWVGEGLGLCTGFLDAMARYYGAGVQVVDFEHAAGAARDRINAHVAERTGGRIPAILSSDLDPFTRLVVTDTLWFKAPWAQRFSAQGVRPFQRGDGAGTGAPTMLVKAESGSLQGGYGEGAGWKAAELPYLGGALSMVVIVPDDLAVFETGLDGARLSAITGGLHDRLLSVQMPRWTARTRLPADDQLKALGLRSVYSGGSSLSGLAVEPLDLASVAHETFVSVDEDGTEAASATAGVITGVVTTRPPAVGASLVVDRPFVYAIRDTATGAVLFLGRVVDPSIAAD